MTPGERRTVIVTPGELVREAGRQLGALREVEGAAVAAASAARPWGEDEAGRAFERRYRPVEAQVLGAWEQLARYVERLDSTRDGASIRDRASTRERG
jgi:hypothetical protein